MEYRCQSCGSKFYTNDAIWSCRKCNGCRSKQGLDLIDEYQVEKPKRKRNKTEYSARNYNEHTCAICGSKFLSIRKEAKYCSDDCRKEADKIPARKRNLRNYYKKKEKKV